MPSSPACTEHRRKDCRSRKSRSIRMKVEVSHPSLITLNRAPITIPVLRRLSLTAPCRITFRISRETQELVICLPRKLLV